MAKSISKNSVWLAAAAAGAWLLMKAKGSISGIGATKATVDYKRDFANRYFENNTYTLSKFMPLEEFIELFANGKAKAMANGKVKLGDKKYIAPATNGMIRRLESALAVEYYGLSFETPHLVEQSVLNPQHPDLYWRGIKVTSNRPTSFDFE